MEAVRAVLADAGILKELKTWLTFITDLRSCSFAPLAVRHMARAINAFVLDRVEPESLHARLTSEHVCVTLVAEIYLAGEVALALRLVAAHNVSGLAHITEIETTCDAVLAFVNLADYINALTTGQIEAEPFGATSAPALVLIQ